MYFCQNSSGDPSIHRFHCSHLLRNPRPGGNTTDGGRATEHNPILIQLKKWRTFEHLSYRVHVPYIKHVTTFEYLDMPLKPSNHMGFSQWKWCHQYPPVPGGLVLWQLPDHLRPEWTDLTGNLLVNGLNG